MTTIVEPGGIRTNFAAGNAVFGEWMDVYRDKEVGKSVSMMKGEVPGPDMSTYKKEVIGDPNKMAQQIMYRIDRGDGPIRMALGSDAYKKIRTSLVERLAALDAQKEPVYSADADNAVKKIKCQGDCFKTKILRQLLDIMA